MVLVRVSDDTFHGSRILDPAVLARGGGRGEEEFSVHLSGLASLDTRDALKTVLQSCDGPVDAEKHVSSCYYCYTA